MKPVVTNQAGTGNIVPASTNHPTSNDEDLRITLQAAVTGITSVQGPTGRFVDLLPMTPEILAQLPLALELLAQACGEGSGGER